VSTPITLTEAVGAALLCLYAISTSRGADPAAPAGGEPYPAARARVEAAYRSAQADCEGEELLAQREVCFRQAKATFIQKILEADARTEPRARSN
jgi:hypothetical protein